MSQDNTDMSQYIGIFLDEGNEQLALLEADILCMERGDHSKEMLQRLFRAAHTLKGSSRTMGFMEIGNLTHEMENVLDALRNDKLNVSTPIIDALLDCLDALSDLIGAVGTSGTDTSAGREDIADLVQRLNDLQKAGLSTAQPESIVTSDQVDPEPEVESLQIDLTSDQIAAISSAKDSGLNVYRIDCSLDDDCMLKAVRGFMVVNAIEQVGSVLACHPTSEEMEADDFNGKFVLIAATSLEGEAIVKEVLHQSEVKSADAVLFEPLHEIEAQEASPVPVEEVVIPKFEEKTEPVAVTQPEEVKAVVETPARRSTDNAPAGAQSQTIRVDIQRLDTLLNLVGELVTDRTQIARLAGDIRERHGNDDAIGLLGEALSRVSLITTELQEEVMKTRMLPIDGVFQRMPRMIRDLAKKTEKEVDFQMTGGETELDRSVLEVLGDPLIHILRNSMDHALETPAEREAVGKPRIGSVTMSARYKESFIVIDIEDDGRGIDPNKIRDVAIKKGLLSESAAKALSDREAINLIMASGFSTAATISDISGRGVGMDIVKSSLEKIGGRVLIESKVGVGSKFSIHLPLTLAILRALMVIVKDQPYVIPLSSVVEMLRLGDNQQDITRTTVGGQAAIIVREQTIPLIDLDNMLQGNSSACSPSHISDNALVVVVSHDDRLVGVCVDSVGGEQEVVLKTLGTLLGEIPGISGASILGDGKVALIVDVSSAINEIVAIRKAFDEIERVEETGLVAA